MADRTLRIGVAGLGRAFTLMLPTFVADRRVEFVAAADPRGEAREKFARDFSAKTYASVEQLCADSAVDVVYVATPHQNHAHHACLAAQNGKHVLVEKPMAITLDECRAMIETARAANVHLIVGHSHSFDAPILRTRALIESGAYGKVRMISALNFTDFLYRPRRPEELDTARGGGVVFSQAAHQIDIVRLLGGGMVRSVRAAAGNWDAKRPTEGAYSALLTFADGAFASITYSGYGHFDSDEFTGWTGELGNRKDPERHGAARRALRDVGSEDEEAAFKAARNYAGPNDVSAAADDSPRLHEHFGLLIVSCEKADLRPQPDGVMIYSDFEKKLDPLPAPPVPRATVIDELYDAVVHARPPLHGGEWAVATTEVILALLQSARESREIALERQIAPAR